MKKYVLLSALLASQIAHAATVGPVVPTSWTIENYVPGNAVAWYTGSTCTNGQLTMPANATAADHSRFYALIMAAKAANQKVFVIYNNSLPGCPIISFGMQ